MSNTSEHPIQEALMKNVHLHAIELKQKNLCPCPFSCCNSQCIDPTGFEAQSTISRPNIKTRLASVQMTQN